MKKEELVKKVLAAGVVGAGGAGFPTHVKYSGNFEIEFFIVNAAECEPLLYTDQELIRLYADELLEGVHIISNALNVKRAYIGIKEKYKEQVKILREMVSLYDEIEIYTLGNFYPAGDEFILVYEVLGRVIPEGGLPLDVGCVVNNVMTVINVARASKGIPVTHRTLTVNGEVKNPSVLSLPIGTSFREAIELAGGVKREDVVLISGGPITGDIVEDWDTPITKTTSGLIVLPEDNYLVMRKRQSDSTVVRLAKSTCDQCMYCTEYCPRNLLGHRLQPHKSAMRAAPYGLSDDKLIISSWLCCECRLCDYFSCPMFLSPGRIHGIMKREMAKAGIRNLYYKEKNPTPHPFIKEKRVPTTRIIHRLQIQDYAVYVKMQEVDYTPPYVKIPLRQHIGAAAIPVVKVGDVVRQGDVIAEVPHGQLGARVHASIDGVVKEISDYILISS